MNKEIEINFNSQVLSSDSCLNESYFVVELIGEINWCALIPEISNCIKIKSKKSFLSIVPWWPKNEIVIRELITEFDAPKEHGELVWNLDMQMINRDLSKTFEIRRRNGGGKSGLWAIGSYSKELPLPRKKDCRDIEFYLSILDELDLLIFCDENQQTLIAAKNELRGMVLALLKKMEEKGGASCNTTF